jgi:hypothetical protein
MRPISGVITAISILLIVMVLDTKIRQRRERDDFLRVGSLSHLEMSAKLLISLEGVSRRFPKCALKSLNNQADFDSAIRMSNPLRPKRDLRR